MNAKSRIAIAAIVSTGAMPLLLRAAGADEAHEIKRPAIAVEVDRAPLRIDAAQLRLAVGESIRAALVEAEKTQRTRQIEVANAGPRNGG
jgi:hypothetical protein